MSKKERADLKLKCLELAGYQTGDPELYFDRAQKIYEFTVRHIVGGNTHYAIIQYDEFKALTKKLLNHEPGDINPEMDPHDLCKLMHVDLRVEHGTKVY